ncbi:cell division protein FtsK [Lentzea sp. NEAU-D13]|uniref:Cell division protein FtsK n=1 Tax=Lentzea alba TaxID=2714351 RepID=A0A7C9RUT3_9PSEU|nr:FtsK/SpoIIIE domain-containing protein [Lentzea alba]NGY63408.1 cell division protein FtsK [Lentzea alba]
MPALVVRVVRQHEPTVKTTRVVLAVGLSVAQGFQSWATRAWDAGTFGVYRRQIRAAEVAGDREALAEWIDRRELATERRHKRLMEAPKLAAGIARVLLGSLVAVTLLMLVTALVVELTDLGSFAAFFDGVLDVLRFAITAVTVVWTPFVAATPLLIGFAAWREGRKTGTVPDWALSPAKRQEASVIVTPGGIAQALAHLGIPTLNKALKDGWTVEFATPPVRVNNRGYATVFSLPLGITPTMIADKRAVLARNLHRDTIEVWPTGAERAGYVDLWVADAGSGSKPAPAYPMLTAGTVDVFASVPFGVSQRGDLIAPPLVEANLVFGGLPGQGKSNAVRVVMLGAALDPLAELWVFVFAGNGDFDAYTPRLARYERGTRPEVAEAALAALHELYAEVGRREEKLAELGVKKVTRALAEKHKDLRPIVAGFSECHELFGNPDFGKEAGEVAVNIVKRGRKTGVILAFDTQSSRAAAIPPALVENVAMNVCFYVKTWRNNDGFLGDGSFQAGIRATELRFNVDRGTAVATGTTDETFELLRWFYIEADDSGFDAAADVIARAMTAVHPSVATGGQPQKIAPTTRDLLEDLDEVLGTDPVPAADVPALLARHAPGWAPYRTLNGKALVAQLAALGVKVPSTGNRWPVRPEDVRAALARAATGHLDE